MKVPSGAACPSRSFGLGLGEGGGCVRVKVPSSAARPCGSSRLDLGEEGGGCIGSLSDAAGCGGRFGLGLGETGGCIVLTWVWEVSDTNLSEGCKEGLRGGKGDMEDDRTYGTDGARYSGRGDIRG